MKLKITVDGKLYEVDVEAADPPAPQSAGYAAGAPPFPGPTAPAASPAPPAKSPSVDEAKVCRSPIAGVVVRVSAQVGQQIQAHDVLVVVEAMKMETAITSPVNGRIAKVYVNPQDSVQAGMVLIEFE